MSKFIVMCGMMILLLWFPMQYVVNQLNYYHMKTAEEIVHNAAQKARTSGYFTPQIISDMKTQLQTRLYVDPTKLQVNTTTTPKYRLDSFDQREMISFDVEIPIDEIVAFPQFFGYSSTQNSMYYPVKGEVPSEVLAP